MTREEFLQYGSRWSERHRVAAFLLLGIGGAAAWVACSMTLFQLIGGDDLVKRMDLLIVLPAAMNILIYLARISERSE